MSGKPNTQTNFDVTPGQDLGGGLEAFVLSGDPWPMAGTSFLETFPHTLKCRERCPDLDFADNWDESDHAPIRLTTWADFRNAHFSDADPMKEKHTEPYANIFRSYFDDFAARLSVLSMIPQMRCEWIHFPQWSYV